MAHEWIVAESRKDAFLCTLLRHFLRFLLLLLGELWILLTAHEQAGTVDHFEVTCFDHAGMSKSDSVNLSVSGLLASEEERSGGTLNGNALVRHTTFGA